MSSDERWSRWREVLDATEAPALIVADGARCPACMSPAAVAMVEAAFEGDAGALSTRLLAVADRETVEIRSHGASRARVWEVHKRPLPDPGSAVWYVSLRSREADARSDGAAPPVGALIDRMGLWVWIVDPSDRIVYWRDSQPRDEGSFDHRDVALPEILGDAWTPAMRDAHDAARRGMPARVNVERHGLAWEVHIEGLDAIPRGMDTALQQGRPGWVMACGVDVTRRRRLQRALCDAERFEAIGGLAGGLAHEINTPMQYVGSNLQFLEMATQRFREAWTLLNAHVDANDAALRSALAPLQIDYLFSEVPGALSQSMEGIDRVSNIVRALKESARLDREEARPVDLNHIVENVLQISENEWKYAATMNRSLAPVTPVVSCVASEITRAILNLVLHATRAVKARHDTRLPGKISVRTWVDGERGCVEVRDDVGDLPQDAVVGSLEDFLGTGARAVATARGLAVARSIFVEIHGGTLDVNVDEGHATSFVGTLPLAPVEPGDATRG